MHGLDATDCTGGVHLARSGAREGRNLALHNVAATSKRFTHAAGGAEGLRGWSCGGRAGAARLLRRQLVCGEGGEKLNAQNNVCGKRPQKDTAEAQHRVGADANKGGSASQHSC